MEYGSQYSNAITPSQVPNFFLDNNIFWVLAGDRNGKKIANWNQSLKDWGICPVPRSIHHTVTAFSFLESIKGKNELFRPSGKQIQSNISDVESYKVFVFDKAKEHFSSMEWLQTKKLREASRKLKEPLSKFGRDFYELIIEHNLKNDNFAEWIWDSLSYDFITSLKAPPQIDRDVWGASLYLDLVRGPANGHNFSLAKATIRHFLRIRRELNLSKERKREFLSNIQLKSTGDHLDGDLITFAVGGLLHNQQMEPVICFTADENIQRTKDRISAQKALLEAAHSHVAEIGQKTKVPFTPLRPQPGYVFICDYHGSIKQKIDVSTINSIE